MSKIKLIPEPNHIRKTQLFRGSGAGTKYLCVRTLVLSEIRKVSLTNALWRNEEVVRFVMVIIYVLWEFISQSSATFENKFFCTLCFAYRAACSLAPKKYFVNDHNFSSWSFGCLLVRNATWCACNTKNEAKGKWVYAYRGPLCYREEDCSVLLCLEFPGCWKSDISVPTERTAGILQSSKDSIRCGGDTVC